MSNKYFSSEMLLTCIFKQKDMQKMRNYKLHNINPVGLDYNENLES